MALHTYPGLMPRTENRPEPDHTGNGSDTPRPANGLRGALGSWLAGPGSVADSEHGNYRGERLGLPESGPGSISGLGRRSLAMLADWLMALGIAVLIIGPGNASTVTLLIWFVIGVSAVTLFGFTPGQFFLGVRMIRVDKPAPVGLVRALAKQALLVFVIPALFTDADGRGMHDQATGTAMVRSR